MAAKILIKRTFREGITREVQTIINQLRTEARNQKGYITGETLQNPDNPRDTLVISTWAGLESWEKWKHSSTRKGLEAALEIHVEGGTRFEIYVSQ